MFRSCEAAVCWLHSVYRRAEVCPLPQLSDRVHRSPAKWRRNVLQNMASKAAMGQRLFADQPKGDSGNNAKPHDLEMPANHPKASLSHKERSLVVSDRDGTELHIPLFMSDVVHAAVSVNGEQAARLGERTLASFVIVIAAETAAMQESIADTSVASLHFPVEPPLKDVWLLCVGNCTPLEFQKILFELNSLGTVRWDLHDVYRVETDSLGTGNFSKVCLGQAHDLAGPKVAVKMLNMSCSSWRASRRQEIDFLTKAHGHPNLPTLFGVFYSCDDGHHVLDHSEGSERSNGSDDRRGEERREQASHLQWCTVMNLCCGGDLHELIASHGAMSEARAIELVVGLLSALDHLHRLHIVHKHVTPDHILISEGRPVLTGFGNASYLGDAVTTTGSPGFAPPEVAMGLPCTEKVDIFAAGAVFYFMLTGQVLFSGSTLSSVLSKTLRCKVSFRHPVFGTLSGSTVELMKALLAKKPLERPTAEMAFCKAFLQLQGIKATGSKKSLQLELEIIEEVSVEQDSSEVHDLQRGGLRDIPVSKHSGDVSGCLAPEVETAPCQQTRVPTLECEDIAPLQNLSELSSPQNHSTGLQAAPPSTPRELGAFKRVQLRCLSSSGAGGSSSSETQFHSGNPENQLEDNLLCQQAIPTLPSQPRPTYRRPRSTILEG
eukprot:TRINITY_DN11514_c0_g1_i1.p1 TRINITY_DN11514_c0_g1~~TRINITY_DN11514_c0_g1_i1.p1  ORF type:complete len:662 (+),score=99.39 TRINITY_DN11514_c0_g1_i1:52-2037(+)